MAKMQLYSSLQHSFQLLIKVQYMNHPWIIDINSNVLVINAIVGDTVTITDLSHSNRGKTLREWDFQYTRPDGNNQFITTQGF
ncbi:MAG: hypothetical protein ACOX3L_10200 [Lutisporaceae bacterium]